MLADILTLIANGSQGTKGTDLFIGTFPVEAPQDAVSVTQYGGADPLHAAGGSLAAPALRRPRFQVCVRNASQASAWTKAYAIIDLLRWYNGTTGSTSFLNIVQLGEPADLGADGTGAFRVAVSFEAWIG